VTIDRASSLVDVAYAVGGAFQRAGVLAVLTGGSAATFYSDAYQSLDLDFVLSFRGASSIVVATIEGLGFARSGSHYVHARSRYTLDFPRGPLMIGGDEIRTWSTSQHGEDTLHVLTRTDCVRDRLSAFYHWNDRSSLRSACVVAASGTVDFDVIRDWSLRENSSSKYAEFLRTLQLR